MHHCWNKFIRSDCDGNGAFDHCANAFTHHVRITFFIATNSFSLASYKKEKKIIINNYIVTIKSKTAKKKSGWLVIFFWFKLWCSKISSACIVHVYLFYALIFPITFNESNSVSLILFQFLSFLRCVGFSKTRNVNTWLQPIAVNAN